MKYRKRLALFMMMVMVITSLGKWQPETIMAADTKADISNYSDEEITGSTAGTVSGSAIGTVSGSAIGTVTGSAITVEDPITPDMVRDKVSTIDEAYTLSKDTIATVIGQVSYIYGSAGTADTALLQDVINNEIIGFQIYDKDKITDYHIGEIVEVTGKIGIYGGVSQLASVDGIVDKGTKTAIPAQELTIAQLLAGGDSYLSELVRIKNVTLGAYSSSKPFNTQVQDSTDSIAIYKAAKYPAELAAGDTADIVAAFSKYFKTYQLRNGTAADYTKIVPPAVSVETPIFSPNTTIVPLGQEITITTSTSGAAITLTVNNGTPALYEETKKPVIDAFPYTISAYATKAGLTDSAVATQTYTQSQVAPVESSVNGAVKLGTKIQLSTQTEGAVITYSVDKGVTWADYNAEVGIAFNVLPVTLLAKATKTGYLDSLVSTFLFTKRLDGSYALYFGQLHSHTDYSDGSGTCDQAFQYAKNTAQNIDFLAITDHSNSFDDAAKASILDGSMSAEWVEGHRLADLYTDSTFVGIYGYEMTWSNGLGHMNTFNTDGFQSRDQSDYKDNAKALPNYYSALKQDTDSISQFNHPGTTFGDFNDFSNYDDAIDKQISLIEVGNGEGRIGSSGYFPSYEYYTRALDKGWHVAPTNNQDNHKGLWGDSNTARTVVLADSLTRSDVYDALRNMRVYATEDNDLQIQYTLNGEVMGTVMTAAPQTVEIKVDVKDPTDSAIGRVDVIVNGGLVAESKNVTTNEETVTFNLPADYSYYYIRVTQNDYNIAVTAPVWIKDVEAAGISKITTTEKLPVKGETLKIQTELFNNEPSPLTVQSMEFSVNDTVIHTADINSAGLATLQTGDTKAYSFDYTNNSVGTMNVKVTVHATLNGVEKIYSNVLKLDYTDPALVTKIVVDGTHFNDYVTGYYGGSLGNLSEIAAGKNMKVIIVKDAFTQEILADCDLLIISAPAKKIGSTNAGAYEVDHFEDEFIDLVKSYTARGGNLILCGFADYQDTANGQSSTEINKLLTAISATSRINSDEAYDTVNNGGKEYRLYLSDYNTSSPYTKGVASDQIYSAYSGCTVLLDSNTVVAGKAEYLVKGHTTTYSIDSKSAGGNYTPIDTGNAIVLAREVLTSGSNVIISGTVFMSDFEIKAAMDNIWDKPYSNRVIMENILETVKSEVTVSNISAVRSGVKGSVYCVEGTVTSGTVAGNAFFDTIYLQDATGGINIFPVNQGVIEVGQKVRIIGSLDEYLGDLELRVISATVVDTAKTPVEPIQLTTQAAMNYSANGGKLVKITGTVTDVIRKNNKIETILLKDSSGIIARVFIDGYIGYSGPVVAEIETYVAVGKTVSAVGLVSYDTEGARLRVRDRREVTLATPIVTPPSTTEPTVTPIPVQTTPDTIPTPALIIKDSEIPQEDSDIKVILSATKVEGIIQAQVEINAEQILKRAETEATSDKPMLISIKLSNEILMKQLMKDDVKKLVLEVTLPDALQTSDKVEISKLLVDAALLKAAREQQKDITVVVKDKSGKVLYSWSFTGKDLSNSEKDIESINISMSVAQISKDSELSGDLGENGLILSFHHAGILPAMARVRVYVGNFVKDDQANGFGLYKRIYLYYYNSKTGKLETLPHSSNYVVDKDGYITISIVNCSNYIVLSKAADRSAIAALKEQIIISLDKTTLSTKGQNKTAEIQVQLPSTLELVNSLEDETSSEAVGAVTVTYESGNKKVAKVDKNGKITAVGKGKTTITVTVDLYSGKYMTYKFTITVK